MNKFSIKKLMATSVLTTIIGLSSAQLVSAADRNCPVNLSEITTNCVKSQYNCSINVIKTCSGNTNCKNININTKTNNKNATNNKVNTASQPKTTKGNTTNSNVASKPSTTKADSSVNALEKEVITLVNAERAKANLPALKANNQLSNVARLKSQDMINKNYFSHTSPTYGSPFDMMNKFGIKYSTAGENIAYGYPTAKAVVDGWMNSPGHRANILNKSFTEIGVGLAKSSNGTYYWTQMFINPSK